MFWRWAAQRVRQGGFVTSKSRPKRRFKKIKHSLRHFKRRYLRSDSSLPDLFSELNEIHCRYVVLRWFEELPSVEKGEDLDVLIDNSHLQMLRGKLSYGLMQRALRRKPIKLDVRGVYPEHKEVSYYPPHLSERILTNSILHPSGARVPCPEDHFFSLAFHALYHKGLASGLPPSEPEPAREYHNKYARTLKSLAKQLNYQVEMTLQDLDQFLGEHGWRPALDYIEKRRSKDPWHKSLIANAHSKLPSKPGLAVFFLRETALSKPDWPDDVRTYLEEEGFNVLACKTLSPDERKRVASELRGGDWGTGPYLRSGGPPAVMIAALDVFPRKPTRKQIRQHPELDNEIVHACKSSIRKLWNKAQAEGERCNIVHSSDNCRQALAYIRIAAPELADQLLSETDKLLGEANLPGEVLHRFQKRARRAVVELIRQADGRLVVRKKFRPGREDYFRREISAIQELHRINPDTVPEILEFGKNYFTMPYYKMRLTQKLRLPLPIPALQKTFLSARQFFNNGYVMLDFRPNNIIVSGRNEVKIIDYEYMFNCSEKEFFQKYNFDDFVNGKIPKFPFFRVFYSADGKRYFRTWGRFTAVPLNSLLQDPLYLVYIKRWTIGVLVLARSVLVKIGKAG